MDAAAVTCHEFVRQRGQFRLRRRIKRGDDRDDVVAERDVLRLREKPLHHLRGHRRPAAVLNQADYAVLVVPLGEVRDERTHEREDVRVVRRRGQHELAVAEGVLHGFGHIVAREVGNRHLRAALRLQQFLQLEGGGLRVAVDARVGDADAGGFDAIGTPRVVLLDGMADFLGRRQERAVERQNLLDRQAGGLFEERLHLRAVLADDADVVAAGLAVPSFGVFDVVRAELAEPVGGEQRLFSRVVRDDDFGPVDHRRRDERELVDAEVERVALLHDETAVGKIVAKEILHHAERGRGRDDDGRRIGGEELRHAGGVVRLHVLDDEVVGGLPAEDAGDVGGPGIVEAAVHGVHHGRLLAAQDDVAVVGHAARDDVLPLEKIDVVVVHAHVFDVR